MIARYKQKMQTKCLQLGRDHLIEEMSKGLSGYRPLFIPSIGPRSADRGNHRVAVHQEAVAPPSIGPRSADRGNQDTAEYQDKDFSLQLGRDQLIAEIGALPTAYVPDTHPSIGPRSADPGNGTREAGYVAPWEPSIGPRSADRGNSTRIPSLLAARNSFNWAAIS